MLKNVASMRGNRLAYCEVINHKYVLINMCKVPMICWGLQKTSRLERFTRLVHSWWLRSIFPNALALSQKCRIKQSDALPFFSNIGLLQLLLFSNWSLVWLRFRFCFHFVNELIIFLQLSQLRKLRKKSSGNARWLFFHFIAKEEEQEFSL